MLTRLAFAMALGLFATPRITRAQSAPPAEPYAWFVDLGGVVLKVDLAKARVIQRLQLPDSIFAPESTVAPEYPPSVEGAAFDRAGPGVVLLVGSGVQDEDQPRHFQVRYLSLPTLAPVARFDLPNSVENVEILGDPVRRRVLVKWGDAAGGDTTGLTVRMAALALPDLREVRRWRAFVPRAGDDVMYPFFHHVANQTLKAGMEVGADSTRLLHAQGDVFIAGDSFFARRPPGPPNTSERREQMRALLEAGPRDRILLGWPVDARGGVALWSSTSDSGPPIQRLETSREGSGEVKASWTAPWGKASLLGAGRTVMVEEHVGPKRASYTTLRRTGRLLFYDAATGKPLGMVTAPELAGRFELREDTCSTSDERFVILPQPGGRLVVVEPGEHRATAVPLTEPVSIAAACFPSAR